MTLDEFRRHPAYDYYIRTLVSDCIVCDLDDKFDLCLDIDCHAVILKQIKYEKK